ncbi:flagellin [Mobiluncus mulieris]|uniref:flagellin N-terminal helical domain-containing protein n=1 Tax=Mobiluncus mulieris TaxID=2052 RepID=UPI00147040EB|nr:flagellin [Mobiluncus mulieris]NMW92014.1 flagellin [Mobiluncus mulieris]
MVVLPGSGSGWVSILGMLRLLIHPTGMCKMPGQGVLVGLAKSLEKLSSGFRINRAADDAAGLAISEGLRSQVGGNRQAVRNAQDGISLVQTAEGALNEVHSILQRMRVLAVQGATDSNSPDARANINTELNQLRDELERIGKVTNFNGTTLLDGSASGSRALKFQVGANGDANNRITVDLKDADVTVISKFGKEANESKVASAKTGLLTKGKYILDLEGTGVEIDLSKAAGAEATEEEVKNALKKGLKDAGVEGFVADGSEVQTSADLSALIGAAGLDSAGKYSLTIDGVGTFDYDTKDKPEGGATLEAIKEGINGKLKDKGYALELDKDGKKFVLKATSDETKNKQVSFSMTTTAGGAGIGDAVKAFKGEIGKAHGTGFEFTIDKVTDGGKSGGGFTFKRADGKMIDVDLAHSLTKLGANPGTEDKKLELEAYGADGKKIDKRADYTVVNPFNSLTVKDHDSAQKLINVLDEKIRSVSTARSNLGAVQNRFEHTITNLNVAVENLAASESRVRDTDMAQEMMQFTRNQILSQAGTSMLAQANQVPQGVLSLLR